MALLPVLPVWPAPAPRWAFGVLRLAALEPATACALGLLAVLWFEGVKRVCRPAVMLRG